jgi:uncharacterized oxidoreductase
MNISGNTILITGGASGIGFALAERFAKANSTVIVCGRRAAQLAEAKARCPQLHTLVADLSLESARVELAARVASEFPKLNVLINNAGIQQRPVPLDQPQDWPQHQLEIATNLAAPMHLSMLLLPQLKQQQRGYLINVTSGLAFVPLAFMPTYCATKAALHSFTLSLRFQLRSSSVRVIEIAPPAVNTDLGGKGLHTMGVALDEFAEHAMMKLAEGQLEFGYQFSESARLSSRSEADVQFAAMNERMAKAP